MKAKRTLIIKRLNADRYSSKSKAVSVKDLNVQKVWKLDRLSFRCDSLVIPVQELLNRFRDIRAAVLVHCCSVQREDELVAVSCRNAPCLARTQLCWVFRADSIAFDEAAEQREAVVRNQQYQTIHRVEAARFDSSGWLKHKVKLRRAVHRLVEKENAARPAIEPARRVRSSLRAVN